MTIGDQMTTEHRPLTGKRCIITGGASGMGEALVRGLSERRARVVSFDLNEDVGAAVAAQTSAHFVACDVTSEQSVNAACHDAAGHLGGLDVLIHASGVAPGAPAAKTDLNRWQVALTVNATGTFLTNVAAWRLMHQRGGRIINLASRAGVSGLPGKAAYAAAKGAVIAWVRSIAVEWAPNGIAVNAVAPSIKTPMYANTRSLMTPAELAEHDADMRRRIPLGGELGDVDRDLVPVLAFLGGDEARFMTDQVFAIDGGLLMMR
jgi:NAD(P)-dependent dehydrogenase (short-subunit alcohol dehydrogenase family)